MKTWLLAFLLLRPGKATAQAWPRNLQTGKIEFAGKLTWPAEAHTARQRRSLVRHWYYSKLTDLDSPVIARRIQQYHEALTYGGLPKEALLRYQTKGSLSQIKYTVELSHTPQGTSYRLSDFFFGWADDDVAQEVPLEKAQDVPNADKAAMKKLRQRLESALAGW